MSNFDEQLLVDAAVAYANTFAFKPGQTILNSIVQSRMALWCIDGIGDVWVNGQPYAFTPGRFLFITWNHAIRYAADQQRPFIVAGIHVIPEYDRQADWIPRVVHNASPEPLRRDVELPGLEDTVELDFSQHDALRSLADHIIHWTKNGSTDEHTARLLGQLFLKQMLTVVQERPIAPSRPVNLTAMISHIRENLSTPLSISVLARLGNCSESTVFRLFQRHCGESPIAFINRERVKQACRLLVTTSLRIGEIGETVGIPDPHYFSRLFRTYAETTARDYRNTHGDFPL